MATKTFQLNLFDGHAIIEDNDNIILIDTGAPSTIHISSSFNFMDSDSKVHLNYGSVTIPSLCDLVGTQVTTLLGMDIISQYKVIFDYPNNIITFNNDDSLKFEGEILGLRRVMNIPVIDAVINQLVVPCFFDAGAKLSYLKASETENLENMGNVSDFYPGIGRFQSPTFEIETKVGNKRFPVLYGNLPHNIESGLLGLVNGNNGILGYDLLKNNKIYMHATMGEFKIAD